MKAKKTTFCRIVASRTRDDAHDGCSPWMDIAGCGCSGNQGSNGPGAKADHAEFPLHAVIQKTPHYATKGRGNHGIPNCHNSA